MTTEVSVSPHRPKAGAEWYKSYLNGCLVTVVTQRVGYVVVGRASNAFLSIILWVFTLCERFQTIHVLLFVFGLILSGVQRISLFQVIVANTLHSLTCSSLVQAPQNKHYVSNKK